jgi:CRISPR-associated protein (TIGR02584 family)
MVWSNKMTTEKNQPEHFNRRILLMVAGHSPAIITETLYALPANQKPTEIRIITTASGKEKLKTQLLGEHNVIHQLCKEYDIPIPLFDKSHIYVIAKQGEELEDTQTEVENEIAADFITAKVRELTKESDCSIHVSIAGGRKTMTYYLGYALSVFGRIQDRMSHVLVEDDYAVNEFFYPTKQSSFMISRKKEAFDAKDVKVMLGELPFIRLRDGLTDDLLNKQDLSYSDIIEIAQRQLRPIKVELRHTPERKSKPWQLLCSGSEITGLNNAELAIYVWLLQRHKMMRTDKLHFNRRPNNEKLAQEFLVVLRQLFGEYNGGFTKASRALAKDDDGHKKEGMTGKYFSPKKTNINQLLTNSLGASGARNYIIIDEIRKASGETESDRTYIVLPPNLQPNDIHLPSHLCNIDEIS